MIQTETLGDILNTELNSSVSLLFICDFLSGHYIKHAKKHHATMVFFELVGTELFRCHSPALNVTVIG